jgi:hypothetical protein
VNALLELAERCEAEAGPDRALDLAIFGAIGAPVPFQIFNKLVALTFDETEQCYFAPVGDLRVRYEPPAFTASFDAALTLVPEGDWATRYESWPANPVSGRAAHTHAELLQCSEKRWGRDIVWGTGSEDAKVEGDAVTPALAICAAALRAKAAQP